MSDPPELHKFLLSRIDKAIQYATTTLIDRFTPAQAEQAMWSLRFDVVFFGRLWHHLQVGIQTDLKVYDAAFRNAWNELFDRPQLISEIDRGIQLATERAARRAVVEAEEAAARAARSARLANEATRKAEEAAIRAETEAWIRDFRESNGDWRARLTAEREAKHAVNREAHPAEMEALTVLEEEDLARHTAAVGAAAWEAHRVATTKAAAAKRATAAAATARRAAEKTARKRAAALKAAAEEKAEEERKRRDRNRNPYAFREKFPNNGTSLHQWLTREASFQAHLANDVSRQCIRLAEACQPSKYFSEMEMLAPIMVRRTGRILHYGEQHEEELYDEA